MLSGGMMYSLQEGTVVSGEWGMMYSLQEGTLVSGGMGDDVLTAGGNGGVGGGSGG